MARLALEIWILNFNCWYQYHLCLLLLFSFYKLHQYLSIQSFIEYATKIYKILEHCLILFAKWCQKWSPFNVGYGIKVVKVTPAQCDVVNHHHHLHHHGFMVDSQHKSFGLHYIVFCYQRLVVTSWTIRPWKILVWNIRLWDGLYRKTHPRKHNPSSYSAG